MKWVLKSLGISIKKSERKSGKSLPSDTVALPRVAACFPEYAVTAIHLSANVNLVVAGKWGDHEVPRALKSTMYQALAPLTSVTPSIMPVLRCTAVRLDRIINSEGKHTPLKTIQKYIDSTAKNTRCPEPKRLLFARDLGLVKLSEDNWNESVKKLIAHAEVEALGYEKTGDKWTDE